MNRKRNALVATDAHVSVIGHITYDEFVHVLKITDALNGYLNRFLFGAARRERLLPLGGHIDDDVLTPLINNLRNAVASAREIGQVTFAAEGEALWRAVYADLTAAGAGLYGAVTARAEAQALRLATLYAVLDANRVIAQKHVLAALAVVSYSDQSARWVFGERAADPLAEEILTALRQRPGGLTRTEIRDLLGRHKTKEQITAALLSLERRGLARREWEETGGRPRERWLAIATGEPGEAAG
jgi:hypothetical protein